MNRYLDAVLAFFAGSDAASETETVRNGLLSYAGEWHALIISLGLGLALGQAGLAIVVATALGLSGWKKISNRVAIRELTSEPWYSIGGGIIGFIGNRFLVGSSVFDVLLGSLI